MLAYGGVSNDFGISGVREHCMFLEDRSQAEIFRQKLLNECLRVSHLVSQGEDAFVDICIIGGGATGVELAAELYNAAQGLRYYGLEVFDESRLRVSLLEAGPRILPALPEHLALAANKELELLGVDVRVNTTVSSIDAKHVHTQDGMSISAELKLWAAGVKGRTIEDGLDGLSLNRNNQVEVRNTLQSVDDNHIFAMGDCCACPQQDGRLVPPRAQSANQMASTVFHNVSSMISGKPLKSFVYRDKGSLVSLSRFSTIGSLMGNLVGGSMAIDGRLARFAYMSLYRLHLITVHGWIKGLILIAIGHANQVIRPKLKLH